MRIACLQYAPQLAETDRNIERADAILQRADPHDIDLLVLPELAFSGYNFKSLGHISPYLEPAEAGISAAWSRQAALKYNCAVVTGYPEKVDPVENWPADPEYYNSAIIVDSDGDVAGNYRKCHLYYTDETWALEGRHGFFTGRVRGLGHVVVGICMDINPYKFEAPWDAYEFSSHVLETGARLVVFSMAWCTHVDQEEFLGTPAEPDMDTLLYWITRLQPIIFIDSNQETIVIFGNRCGAEGDTTYVGTSAVIGIKSGDISVYGILGRDEESLLVVDTDDLPYAKFRLQSREPVPAQDPDEDTLVRPRQPPHRMGPADQWRDELDTGSPSLSVAGLNQAALGDVQEQNLDTIVVTRGLERALHTDDWFEPSRRPRVHPTSGPFRVDGSSVGITPSSSHVSYTRFTRVHVASPTTLQGGADEMRPTTSEDNCNTNRMDGFSVSESDEGSFLSHPESEEEGWSYPHESHMYGDGRWHGAASERGIKNSGSPYLTTNTLEIGPPVGAQPGQDAASESSLLHRISALALGLEVLPTPNLENFKEEDIYKHVHGKNLTSEHHIRYHTHLLREKRARQGLSPEVEEDSEDQATDQNDNVVLKASPDHNESRSHELGRTQLPVLALADFEAQPNYTLGGVAQARESIWMENSAEPTPIADTPMSHMTLFSPQLTRRRHDRPEPAFAVATPVQTRCQPMSNAGAKVAESRAGETRIAGCVGGDAHAAHHERWPALGWSEAKENAVPLQDPSRRPKAAARQVPPLRLVPRQGTAEKGRERGIRERSGRTPSGAPEGEKPGQRENGRKTPVPMVLVYEDEGEDELLGRRRSWTW